MQKFNSWKYLKKEANYMQSIVTTTIALHDLITVDITHREINLCQFGSHTRSVPLRSLGNTVVRNTAHYLHAYMYPVSSSDPFSTNYYLWSNYYLWLKECTSRSSFFRQPSHPTSGQLLYLQKLVLNLKIYSMVYMYQIILNSFVFKIANS